MIAAADVRSRIYDYRYHSEAQAMLSQLLAGVAQGEEVLIADGGLRVARLIQPAAPAGRSDLGWQ